MYLLRDLLAASGQPALVIADLSSLRLRASARPDVLNFAVDPTNDDSRYAATAYRTTIVRPDGPPLAVAVVVDQYGNLHGIDVTDPTGRALTHLPTPGVGVAGAAGGPAWVAPPASANRHSILAIIGFILSLLPFFFNLAGLIVSIIALVKSKRAGTQSGFALAGVLIGSASVLLTALVASILIATLGPIFVDAAETCARLGVGVHEIGDATYTCGYGSFSVTRGY